MPPLSSGDPQVMGPRYFVGSPVTIAIARRGDQIKKLFISKILLSKWDPSFTRDRNEVGALCFVNTFLYC